MHHSFRDPFPVKVRHFVQEGEVLYGDRTPLPHSEGVAPVINRMPVTCGQNITNLLYKQRRQLATLWKIWTTSMHTRDCTS